MIYGSPVPPFAVYVTPQSKKELAFDISDFDSLIKKTEKMREDLEEQKTDLEQGLEELRKDWRTPAGKYFFEQLDGSWEEEVAKFINTISIFEEILKNAKKELQEVEDKAKSIKIDLA